MDWSNNFRNCAREVWYMILTMLISVMRKYRMLPRVAAGRNSSWAMLILISVSAATWSFSLTSAAVCLVVRRTPMRDSSSTNEPKNQREKWMVVPTTAKRDAPPFEIISWWFFYSTSKSIWQNSRIARHWRLPDPQSSGARIILEDFYKGLIPTLPEVLEKRHSWGSPHEGYSSVWRHNYVSNHCHWLRLFLEHRPSVIDISQDHQLVHSTGFTCELVWMSPMWAGSLQCTLCASCKSDMLPLKTLVFLYHWQEWGESERNLL